MRGARRRLGVAPVKKSPSLDVDIQRMVAAMPEDAARARDRALLLLGFAGAFRRSELVAIDIERLTLSASGLVVRLPRSKTDQIGAGRSVAVSRELASQCCPVEAVEQLLKLLPPTGPLFRSLSRRDEGQRLEAGWVARVVKTCAARIGADPRRLAGHSLRRGFVTSAHRAGRSMQAMQKVTGHKKFDTLAGYIDDEVDWSSAAGRGLLGGK